MFPISDQPRPGRGIAIVTVALIIINVLAFLYELSLGAGVENFILTYGAVPKEILTGQDIPPAGPDPIWLQLLTSMFLHGGWLHIIGNMAYLRVFGDDIEDVLGPSSTCCSTSAPALLPRWYTSSSAAPTAAYRAWARAARARV